MSVTIEHGVPAIGFRRRKMHIGIFASEEAAARAYDAKAKELHGEFARLNFPDSTQECPACA